MLKKFIVKYTPDRVNFLEVIITAATYTKAYLAFMLKYPAHYEISEITEQCSVEA